MNTMKDTEGGVDMVCSYCKDRARYSPLRLGRQCGKCHQGTWIPIKAQQVQETTK